MKMSKYSKYLVLLILTTLYFQNCAFAQQEVKQIGKNDTIILPAVIVDGDTIPYIYLPTINIYAARMFKSKREQIKYTKLRRDVTKVWPYAKLAGEMMSVNYRNTNDISVKSDSSPVTSVDKAINTLLIERVKEMYPNHGVLGEEESWHSDSDVLWVCDPIDGTVAYIEHIPTSMFSLALVIEGEPVVAIAYNPWTNDMYHAIKHGGSYRNEESISVSSRSWGPELRLLGSSNRNQLMEPVDFPDVHKRLRQLGIYVSDLPGTVFKGCLIAEGSADGRIFMHHGAHDIAALQLIVEEAGGRVTDLSGNKQKYNGQINGAIISNGLIHENLQLLVKENAHIRN